jgi:menaquinone-dependent protoporphyrinogen oxidase
MRILIVFGTTEGHTREVCQFAARCLREAGHAATTEAAGPNNAFPDPTDYDAVLLAASLHVGQYQPALENYARRHHEVLNAGRSAFISVSLSAAGENPDDWEGLDACLARFQNATQWTPREVHHVAGAIRNSQYDFFKRLALKHIAAKRGHRTEMNRDYDLTDYEALKAFVLAFAGEAEAPRDGEPATAAPSGSPRPDAPSPR